MKKSLMIIISGLVCLSFLGCGSEDKKIVKVFVDENETKIKTNTKLPIIKMSYACDERGYKYYKQHTYQNDIYLPLFKNTIHASTQVMCD